jgi:hypothetical protein
VAERVTFELADEYRFHAPGCGRVREPTLDLSCSRLRSSQDGK